MTARLVGLAFSVAHLVIALGEGAVAGQSGDAHPPSDFGAVVGVAP